MAGFEEDGVMGDILTRPESVVVVSLDGWNSGFLGPYGTSWFETPFLDRFAASGTVFERVLTTTCDPTDSLRRCWTDVSGRFRFDALTTHGIPSRLITDDINVAALGRQLGFQTIATSRLPTPPETPQEKVDDTRAFQDVAHALGVLEREGLTGLTWIHWRGLADHWDAPLELRERLRDEEDPPASHSVSPPKIGDLLPQDLGEREDYRFTQHVAYAAQVQVWDAALQFFFESLDALGISPNTLKVLTATRGFALGDHGEFGLSERLFSEMLQLPLLVSHHDDCRAIRTQRLTRLDEVGVTLENLIFPNSQESSEAADPLREAIEDAEALGVPAICSSHHGETAIRTDAWFLRRPLNGPISLFVKPDDRFEQVDVFDRLPETSERLVELLVTWDNDGRPRAPSWLRENLPDAIASD